MDSNFLFRVVVIVLAGAFIGTILHEGFHAMGGVEKAICVGNYSFGNASNIGGIAFTVSNAAPESIFHNEFIAYTITVATILGFVFIGKKTGVI